MKIWLIALSVLIAGCGTVEVRESSTFFSDYEVEKSPTRAETIELPELHEVEARGGEVVMSAEAFDALMAYQTAAEANTTALRELSVALWHAEREVYFLVMAGRQVEREASLFRDMYLAEAQQCRFYQYGIVGLGGVSLFLTGIAF